VAELIAKNKTETLLAGILRLRHSSPYDFEVLNQQDQASGETSGVARHQPSPFRAQRNLSVLKEGLFGCLVKRVGRGFVDMGFLERIQIFLNITILYDEEGVLVASYDFPYPTLST
jgi:hypothetical protein